MKQEKQTMTKYEYCCVLGGSDNMSKVAARANDGWRVVSVDGHQGYAFFYMEREVRTEPLTIRFDMINERVAEGDQIAEAGRIDRGSRFALNL